MLALLIYDANKVRQRRHALGSTGGRSVRCSLLYQQAFRLEKQFEVDDGFHHTPLVPGCLEALQYVSPGVARSAQCHLPNKPYSLCCAAQYYWRARADTQLRINWEVRHGHLTPCRCPKFHPRSNSAPAEIAPDASATVRCPRPARRRTENRRQA
jgi:hypothetical protein